MKEIVQYKESDKEMVEAFRNLQKEVQRVYEMWDKRYQEAIPFFNQNRKAIIEELGGVGTKEADSTDIYLGCLMRMRNQLQSLAFRVNDEYNWTDLNYIKPL